MHSTNAAMKPALRPPLQSSRLLDQVRERICYCHYSIRTESAYVYQVRDFARFSGLRHPRELGGPEVQTFLTHLAAQRRVSPSTHRQALCALLFLYREVLGPDLPWLEEIGRPKAVVRIPVVLSRDETARLIAEIEGTYGVVVRLLYGAGLRLLECLRLQELQATRLLWAADRARNVAGVWLPDAPERKFPRAGLPSPLDRLDAVPARAAIAPAGAA